jgi:hypothetical protein
LAKKPLRISTGIGQCPEGIERTRRGISPQRHRGHEGKRMMGKEVGDVAPRAMFSWNGKLFPALCGGMSPQRLRARKGRNGF